MQNKKEKIIIIYILILILLGIIIYGAPRVKNILHSTYTLKYGNCRAVTTVQGYILRDDFIGVSDRPANIKRIAKEGTLVGGGDMVIHSSKGGSDSINHKINKTSNMVDSKFKAASSGKAMMPGTIFYSFSGNESKLSISNGEKLSEEELKSQIAKREILTGKGNVAKGEPIYRIVTGGSWYLVSFLDEKQAEQVKDKEYISIESKKNKNKEKIRAKIISIQKSGNRKYKLIISSNSLFKIEPQKRKVKLNLITADADGLLIKKKSTIKRSGKIGVLVRDKVGKDKFVPIGIIADDGKNFAVMSDKFIDAEGHSIDTVKIYDEIIKSPKQSGKKK